MAEEEIENDLGPEPQEEGGGIGEVTQSPIMQTEKLPVQMDFYDALREIMEGKIVTKLEWKNKGYYGVLDGSFLKLHKPDGKLYSWILNDGDINGTDYVLVV
jgi:hypothetical protein